MAIDNQLSDLLNTSVEQDEDTGNMMMPVSDIVPEQENDLIDVDIEGMDEDALFSSAFDEDEQDSQRTVTEEFVPDIIKESTVSPSDMIESGVGDDVLLGGQGDDDDVSLTPPFPVTSEGTFIPETDIVDVDVSTPDLADVLSYSPHMDFSGLTTAPEKTVEVLEDLGRRFLDPFGEGADQPNKYGIRMWTIGDASKSAIYGFGKQAYDLISLGYTGLKYTPEVIEFLSKAIPLKDPMSQFSPLSSVGSESYINKNFQYLFGEVNRELLERAEDVDNKPIPEDGQDQTIASEAADAVLDARAIEAWGRRRYDALQHYWDIPADRKNAFNRFTQLLGEYSGLITVMRKAGMAGGVSLLDNFGITSPTKATVDDALTTLEKKILNTSDDLATKDRDTSIYLRHLHRKYEKLRNLREDLYQPQLITIRGMKYQGETVRVIEKGNLFTLSKDIYKPIGEMAAGAALAQTATEQSLDMMGMSEYKPYAVIAGFTGALAGAGLLTQLASKAPKAGYHMAENIGFTLRAIYAKKMNYTQEYRRFTLRAAGYSAADVTSFYTQSSPDAPRVITKETFESKLIDPKIRKTMDGMAQALYNIPDESIRNEIFASIRALYDESDGLMRGFNRQLQKDIDDGLIKIDNVDDLAAELRLNFDQMMHLTAMTSMKNLLTQRLKLGLVRDADKMKMLQTLDMTTRGLQQQTRLFEKGLEGILKRVSQISGEEGLPTETNFRAIHDHMRKRKEILTIQNEELSAELLRTLEKLNPLDPSKGPEFDAFMDDVFGKSLTDDISREAMAVRASLGIKETGELDDLQRLRIRAEAQRRFGNDVEKLFDGVQRTFRDKNRTLYLAAGASDDVVPIESFMSKYSALIDQALPKTAAGKTVTDAKAFITRARRDGLELEVKGMRQQGYDDEEIFITLYDTNYLPAIRALEKNKVVPKKPIQTFFDADNNLKVNALNDLVNAMVRFPIDANVAEFIPANASYQTMRDIVENIGEIGRKASTHDKKRAVLAQYNLFDEELERIAAQIKEGKDIPSTLKHDIADTWFKNTTGETFKKWAAARIDHNLHNKGVTQLKDKTANYEYFNDLIDFNDPVASANQFVTMFATRRDMKKLIKDADGNMVVNPNFGKPVPNKAGVYEIDPEAKRLFLMAMRRRLETANNLDKKGLQNFSDVAIDELFVKTGILNPNNKADMAKLQSLAKYRNLEASNPDMVKQFEASKKVLTENLNAITNTLQAKLGQSAFEAVRRTEGDADKLFDYLLTDTSIAVSIARTEASFLRRAVDSGELPPEVYDNLTRNRRVLESDFSDQLDEALRLRQERTGEKISREEYLDRLTGMPVGDTSARQPLLVILDDFEKNMKPEKLEEFKSAIKSLMVSSLMRRNISFSNAKQVDVTQKNNSGSWLANKFTKAIGPDQSQRMLRALGEAPPEQPSLWVQSTQDLPHAKITLAKQLDMQGFVEDFNNIPDEVLKRIYTGEEGAAHLEYIKKLTQIGSALYGKTPTGSPQDMLAGVISRTSLLNKAYNWSRGFVSGRFILWDLAARQSMINQANYLERILTDPKAAETMVNFIKDGPKEALKYKKFWKELAMSSAVQAEEMTVGPSDHPDAKLSRLYFKPEKVLEGYLKSFFDDIAFGYNRRYSDAIKGKAKRIDTDEDIKKQNILPLPGKINLDEFTFQ